jgi:hypothetical protein
MIQKRFEPKNLKNLKTEESDYESEENEESEDEEVQKNVPELIKYEKIDLNSDSDSEIETEEDEEEKKKLKEIKKKGNIFHITNTTIPIANLSLDPKIIKILKKMEIEYLFPVQKTVIPITLAMNKSFIPGDILGKLIL